MVLQHPEQLDPARLRAALAQVLSDFGSVAGRLVRDRGAWYIDHGFGGVFETADTKSSWLTQSASHANAGRRVRVSTPRFRD